MNRSHLLIGALFGAAVFLPLLYRVAGFPQEHAAAVVGIGVVYALMALSLNFMLGHAGLLSLGHAGFLGVGAFTSGLLTVRFGLAMGVGLLAAAAVGTMLALIVGIFLARVKGPSLAIGTFAFAALIQESIFRWNDFAGGRAGITLPRPRIGSFVFDNEVDYLALLLIALASYLVLDANVSSTVIGRRWHAVRWSEKVATALAIDPRRANLGAIVMSGATGAVAGVLYGHLVGTVNADTFGMSAQHNLSLVLLMLIVLGGLAKRTGILIAAGIFALAPELLTPLRAWEFVLGGVALIVAVVRHPMGIGERFRPRTSPAPLRADITLPSPRPSQRSAASLEVQHLRVTIGGYSVLSEVTTSIAPGHVAGIIGPNGAGKSMLLNAISGHVPHQGWVSIGGERIDHLPPHARAERGLGRTFQAGGLIEDVPVQENLLLGLSQSMPYRPAVGLLGLPPALVVEKDAIERVREVADAIGLGDRLNDYAGVLSVGQQRVVEIARALLTQPTILLLDEPTSGLAPSAAESVFEHLETLRGAGVVTMVVVDHSGFVKDICDSLLFMEAGEEVVQGPPAKVMAHDRIASYLGTI